MDGAHTHHPGPSSPGIGIALLIGAGLAVATQVAHAVAVLVSALLISLAVAVGLAVAGLTACAVIGYRRRHASYRPLRSGPDHVPLAGGRDVVSLGRVITELHAQLAAARPAVCRLHISARLWAATRRGSWPQLG
jgi:hypothetical protein